MEHPYPIRPAERPAFPSHVHYSGANALFTPAECEAIIRLGESLNLEYATIGNGTNNSAVLDKKYRSVKGAPLWREKPVDSTWLYERLATRAEWANRDNFRFDLTGLGEPPQFLKYEATDEVPGHYDWHQDFGAFYRAVEWMGLQRHLKVAGIFARLTLRDGKPKYLADAPRFIGYIRATASRYRELTPLLRLIDEVEGIAPDNTLVIGRG